MKHILTLLFLTAGFSFGQTTSMAKADGSNVSGAAWKTNLGFLQAADVSGTYQPLIADGGLSLAKLAQASATSGQVIKWNGSAWAPAADSGGTVDNATLNAAIATNPTATRAVLTENWVFEGDSWTAGTAQGNDRETWPYYLMRTAMVRNRITGYNVATAGQTAATMVSTFAAQVAPYLTNTSGKPSTAFLFAGINDAGGTTTQLRDNLRSLWTSARNEGATVVAFTLPQRGAGAGRWSDADWATINAQIIADSSYYDHLVRMDIICSNSAASYYTDAIHINTASHSILANRILEVLSRGISRPINNPDLVCNACSTSALSAGTRRNLPFTEAYDANGDGTTATVGSDSVTARVIVPVDGTYEISSNILLGSLASGDNAYLSLWHTPVSTGTEVEHRLHYNLSAGANMGIGGTKRIQCSRGDFLNVSVTCSKASASILNNANFASFQVRLVSIP